MDDSSNLPRPTELLLIQKFVFLLDEYHLKEYQEYLSSINARLPLRLITSIAESLPAFDSHDDLCSKVYRSDNKNNRQNFNQLSSYTFKLSAFLAQNYPSYLSHNFVRVQQLIAHQKLDEALFLSKTLADVAHQTEDYDTLIPLLKFEIQHSYLVKNFTAAAKLEQELAEVSARAALQLHLVRSFRQSSFLTENTDANVRKRTELGHLFSSHKKNDVPSIRILATFSLVYLTYHHHAENFSKAHTAALIERLEKDLFNFGYVVLPYLLDIRSNLGYLKTNTASFLKDEKASKRELEELSKHYKSLKYWGSYLNIPEMFSITSVATLYLTQYHFLVHRPDYAKILHAKHRAEIEELVVKCEHLILLHKDSRFYKNDMVSLRLVYSALLITLGGDNVLKGIQELESTLITYQQLNFAGSMDSIYVCLMVGYFATKNYQKCSETFKRYIKVTKGKTVFDDNDIDIHTYYYVSQWLSGHRKQYIQKLRDNYLRATANDAFLDQQTAILELTEYFKMPLNSNRK